MAVEHLPFQINCESQTLTILFFKVIQKWLKGVNPVIPVHSENVSMPHFNSCNMEWIKCNNCCFQVTFLSKHNFIPIYTRTHAHTEVCFSYQSIMIQVWLVTFLWGVEASVTGQIRVCARGNCLHSLQPGRSFLITFCSTWKYFNILTEQTPFGFL